jgi:hypothetical protein
MNIYCLSAASLYILEFFVTFCFKTKSKAKNKLKNTIFRKFKQLLQQKTSLCEQGEVFLLSSNQGQLNFDFNINT